MAVTILAIDIGNTNIKLGLFKDHLIRKLSLKTHPIKSKYYYEEELTKFINKEHCTGGVIASVVPSLNDIFSSLVESVTGQISLLVNHSIKTGLKLDIKEPEKMGADRLANAVASYDAIKDNVIAVDFGSATTFTVVERDGTLPGGIIMPGVEMMCIALKEQTGKLPLVSLSSPYGPLGKDTKSSIIPGVLYGTAGAVERLIDEVSIHLGNFVTVITGGNAIWIKDILKREFHYIPELTLMGLKIIYERNT